jgi:16S rRNA (guanine527-N7)-methyltransferase
LARRRAAAKIGAVTATTDKRTLVEKCKALQVVLPEDRAALLLAYLDAMLALNEQINLTAVRDREAAVVLHVLDGLAFARTGLRPHHVLDLGSGNGFPGVCVAALHPGASVVLLDRTGKKVRAMGSCLLTAHLDGVETMHLDAAQAPALRRDLRHAFDLVVARAVSRPAAVAELADPLLRPGGHLVLWLEADAELPQRLGSLRRVQTLRYDLPEPAARQRVLGHWRKGP